MPRIDPTRIITAQISLALLSSVIVLLAGCPSQQAETGETLAVKPGQPASEAVPETEEPQVQPQGIPYTWLSVSSLDHERVFPLGDLAGKPLVVSFFAMY